MAGGIGAISGSASGLTDAADSIVNKTIDKMGELDGSEEAAFNTAMAIKEASTTVDIATGVIGGRYGLLGKIARLAQG